MSKYKLYTVFIFLLLGVSFSPGHSENASGVSETEETEVYEADNDDADEKDDFTVNESDVSSSSDEQLSEEDAPTGEIDGSESQQGDGEANAEKPKKLHWLDALLQFALFIACTR